MYDFWSLNLKGLKAHSLEVQTNSLTLYKEVCFSKTSSAESSQISVTCLKIYTLEVYELHNNSGMFARI